MPSPVAPPFADASRRGRVSRRLRQEVSERVLGRDGVVGRRYIGGTDEERERYARLLRQLDAPDLARRRRVAESLGQHGRVAIPPSMGFAVFGDDHFEHVDDVVVAARAIMEAADPLATAGGMPNKPQLFTGILPSEDLTLASPFLRFALQPAVLRPISAYLGGVPVLYNVDLWFSVSPNTEALSTSQLYHSDWEGLSQIRLLVYVHDVKPTDGPFVVMEAEASRKVRKQTGYTFFRDGSDRYGRIEDEQVQAVIGDRRQHRLDGPTGTVAFVDTAQCLHYGSRVDQKATRTLFACQFLAPSSFVRPLRPEKRAPYSHLVNSTLSELQALALGA